jgi:hypothetical protein
VLTGFPVALAGGAAAVAVGWCLRRSDELGRPRPFPWVSMALLVALAVAGAVPGVLRTQQERRLGRAASELAGARVAVRCQSLGGAFVDGGPEPWALIKRDQCRDLGAYVRSGTLIVLAVVGFFMRRRGRQPRLTAGQGPPRGLVDPLRLA